MSAFSLEYIEDQSVNFQSNFKEKIVVVTIYHRTLTTDHSVKAYEVNFLIGKSSPKCYDPIVTVMREGAIKRNSQKTQRCFSLFR